MSVLVVQSADIRKATVFPWSATAVSRSSGAKSARPTAMGSGAIMAYPTRAGSPLLKVFGGGVPSRSWKPWAAT